MFYPGDIVRQGPGSTKYTIIRSNETHILEVTYEDRWTGDRRESIGKWRNEDFRLISSSTVNQQQRVCIKIKEMEKRFNERNLNHEF